MAHVAQALFIFLVGAAVALLLLRAAATIIWVLYTRPMVLWTATAIAIPALLLFTGAWHTVDARGLLHFILIAVVAFTAVTILCEGYRILKKLFATRH